MYKKVVTLYGVPRTGTTWLGQIFDSCPETVYRYQPLFSYRFKNRIKMEDSKNEITKFLEELYLESEDSFLSQREQREKGLCPIFENKNPKGDILVYKEARYLYTVPLLLELFEDIKVIGIVRNPVAVLESWMNASSEYKDFWKVEEEWMFAQSKNEYRPENYYGYYKWKECMKMFLDMKNKYPDNFMIVRYEDLYENAVEKTKELFSFADVPFAGQTEDFIINSQSRTVDNAYSVYRAKSEKRQRKRILSEEIKAKIFQDLQEFDEAHLLGYGEGLL